MRGIAARVLSAVLVVTALAVPAGAAPPDEDASCRAIHVQATLGPFGSYHVAGWLCATAPYDGQTVILASPSGFSTHAYWDWPVEKDTYSFVRAMTGAGYAVFNYDRIGTGQSDRPAAPIVNLESEAALQHQLVEGLRDGSLAGVRFGKVVLAGNSLSTLIDIFQAETYADVDGLIDTGIFVGPSPVGLAKLFAAVYPAQADPKFASDPSVPPGYFTTLPGSRSQFFYEPSSDPATEQLDEQLKDTATFGEFATFPAWVPFTRLVNVPVLSLVGDHDLLACITVCTPGGIETIKEQQFWSPQTCLQIEILPDAGHFVQLQANSAAASAALERNWLARRIGLDGAHPATQPCTG